MLSRGIARFSLTDTRTYTELRDSYRDIYRQLATKKFHHFQRSHIH